MNASGAIQRQGLERLRHVDSSFFVQSLNAQNPKGLGRDNPADVCTKSLKVELMTKHVSAVSGQYSTGRPTLCPEVLDVLDAVQSSSWTVDLVLNDVQQRE